MDFPKDFKNIDFNDITTDKAIELLLAAIAFEQFGLGKIINAEADKINHAVSLGEKGLATLDEVKEINDSALKVLKAVIKKEMLLEFELDDLTGFIPTTSTSSTTSTTTTTSTSTASTTTTRSSTTTASTSTTTSRTCTTFTTTKHHHRCNCFTLLEILLIIIFVAIKHCCRRKFCIC